MDLSPASCVICRADVNPSVVSPCIKGHHQCQVCSVRMNGFCGVCTAPLELQATTIGSEALVAVVPDAEVMVLSDNKECMNNGAPDYWNSPPDPNKYLKNIVDGSLGQCGEPSPNQCMDDDRNFGNVYINPMKESEYLSPSLMDILRNLHETKCSSSCTTFDYCVRQILWQQLDYSQASSYSGASENMDTMSISDILKNIHKNSCGPQCKNMMCCLSSTLKHLVEQRTENDKKDIEKSRVKRLPNYVSKESIPIRHTHYEKNECNAVTDKESNVIRACYRSDKNVDLKSNRSQPQFEVITTFSTLSSKSQKDFSLPFSYESNATTASVLKCPLWDCNITVEDRNLCKHLSEKHKHLELVRMQPNTHKLFFVDPSVLECNEFTCVASYMIPNVFKVGDEIQTEMQGLPLLVMACKVNLKDLPYIDLPPLAPMQKTSDDEKLTAKVDESGIDAEVAETIYGVKTIPKNEPVKWAKDDVLIICPIAPIPKPKAICTSIVTFAPEKPVVNFSASFSMRSIRDFTTISELFGAPDTIFLTSVDITALTSNGQHVIHCQIMCKL